MLACKIIKQIIEMPLIRDDKMLIWRHGSASTLLISATSLTMRENMFLLQTYPALCRIKTFRPGQNFPPFCKKRIFERIYSIESHWILMQISQCVLWLHLKTRYHWFRYCLVATRTSGITWTNAYPDPQRHMASSDLSDSTSASHLWSNYLYFS